MPEHNDWNKKIIDEFRANQGRVGGFFEVHRSRLSIIAAARAGGSM